ncbi:serine/arginine repetitive matrix protein 2 isoform X1 [Solea solea]|uniref:serine/arginine repetitive matrix protein 2 isoform X1 n=1 Tax=Solea solea TaxID=90069 RepID=UPI00272D3753|nr:serine/arginine repetitive matrix protein 2 isoform X1 [Solea solea]
MATVQCHKCTVEKRGFRRELDSWRHKLIHCIGFESILEGIYGPMLLRDLNVFDDCEPEEVEDWSPESSCSQCSFCNLPLDKLSDQVPAATSPLSSPSDYSPCQAPSVSESSQSAHRFLQAVFNKKDAPLGCESTIPLVAQELMKKMIHQFAMDYASKCLQHTSTNGVRTRTPSPLSETSDAPLDLTVSRTQEERESEHELDGVLDLSNRNSASSATSSSSSNNKTSGSLLPSFKGHRGLQRNKFRQISALDAVVRALCPAHRSLLYQMLKQAQQENLLSLLNRRPAGQAESYCCQCGVNPPDKGIPHALTCSERKANNSSLYYPLMDCDDQGHGNTMFHSGDSKSNCSIHLYPLNDCKNDGSLGSNYCCVHRCRMETYTVLCPKRLHCLSCQSLAVGPINSIMCSFTSAPTLSKSPSLCTPSSSSCPSSSICCNPHTPHSCPCYSNHACPLQDRSTIERGIVDGDPPVLKREHSPSPPPLSPIPSDISKKTDETPPALLQHRQDQETDTSVKNNIVNASQQKKEVLQCSTLRRSQTEQSPNGILLQDVVNRFSEKLETIKPLEKDPAAVSTDFNASEKEKLQSPSTSQDLQFPADAHLTEIITKVLHKGNGSDYNLSELFNRHDSEKPKSPNTRSRRRQEVLAAIATPADDSATRRHSLQSKRELAMLYQSCNRKKAPPAKKAKLNNGKVTVTTTYTSSDSSLVKGKSEREIELKHLANHKVEDISLGMLSAEVKDEIETVVVTEDILILKAEENEREMSCEEKDLTLFNTQTPTTELQTYGKELSKGHGTQRLPRIMTVTTTSVKQCVGPCKEHREVKSAGGEEDHEESPSGQNPDSKNRRDKNCHIPVKERQKSNHSKEVRRSRRSIVPPQRFSSFVTEPRKMFFAACSSDSIFNQGTQKDDVLTSSTLDDSPKDPDAKDTQLETGNDPPLSSPEQIGKLALESTEREQYGPSHIELRTITAKDKSPIKHGLDTGTDGNDLAVNTLRILRSQPRLKVSMTASRMPKNSSSGKDVIASVPCVEKPPNYSQVQYTSPIKLMFVSAVKDKGEVRYSLKSASSGSNPQAEEAFDPYEESSWSGTPEKQTSQSTESPTSKVKSTSSPLKSATSPVKSACSPTKSASSPAKSAPSTPKSASPLSKSVSSPRNSAPSTPKSASSPNKSVSPPSKSASSPKSTSSSPKIGSRRSGESTPTKRIAGTESQRSLCDLSFHETTPPKRRPGRPKKLGPQLEQKVKRPIGRPRKQKAVDSETGEKSTSGKIVLPSDAEENANKNLKITVVYGRSRRNKRMVSEGFEQLQTEFHDASQAVGLKRDLGILMNSSRTSSGTIKATSTEPSKDLKYLSTGKESPLNSSNIKCQKQDDAVPSRKPGRPAKVKISGISVTVTTVSPRQRKIQIKRDTRQSPKTQIHKKLFLTEFKSAKESRTISYQSTNRSSQTEKGTETKNEINDKLPNQLVPVRHSLRVRKPSIHFLHAVATSTSRSYSHSNALLRRSKQLLLNKASNEKRKEEQQRSAETSGGKKQLFGQDKRKSISQNLSRVSEVSVDSIFTPKETLRWWSASTEEKTMNHELARRIRLISDTWISDGVGNEEKEIPLYSKPDIKDNNSFTTKSKCPSAVRTLFDCSPNKPRSCSMQQLSSWFMQTTETQSLAIVKKASSRNNEPRHFPRSTHNKNVCYSPQAERLRKHIKKFAKTVPKSPLQHQLAQRRMRKKNEAPLQTRSIRRQLFLPRFASDKCKQGVQWQQSLAFRKYQATVFRAKKRFLTRKERERWRMRQRNKKNLKVTNSSNEQQKHEAFRRLAKDQSDCLENRSAKSSVDQTREPVDVPKEQNLSSKAWSPETIKECRVFLRKINSPDNESTEEEWDSCTVTLDDGSPSAYVFAARERELVGVVKAVNTKRVSINRRKASRDLATNAPKSVQEQGRMPARRRKCKYKSPGVLSTESPQPPPAKMLRQSRMRGLTGPRWCDFVFEN